MPKKLAKSELVHPHSYNNVGSQHTYEPDRRGRIWVSKVVLDPISARYNPISRAAHGRACSDFRHRS